MRGDMGLDISLSEEGWTDEDLNINQNARKVKSKARALKSKTKANRRKSKVSYTTSEKELTVEKEDEKLKTSRGAKIDTTGRVIFGSSGARTICINFLTVIISTIGLLLVVLAYCCLGGSVFEWLESNIEKETKITDRLHVAALVKQHAANLYARLQLDAANQTLDTVSTISIMLKNVSVDAYKIADETSWDGERIGRPVLLDWTLSGAILFSVTTITTIGYGFIAPITTTGRIICIFYSVFGMPITMLAIANLGLWFARQVRKTYKMVVRLRYKYIDESRVTEVPVIISLIIMVGYILGGAYLFSKWEDNIGFIDGAYFCFITLTTIGFGDIVPGVYTGKGDWLYQTNETRAGGDTLKLTICGLYLFFGLSLLAMCMDLMKEEVRANFLWLGYKTNLMAQKTPEEVIEDYIRMHTGR